MKNSVQEALLVAPASYAQQRLWFLEQVEGNASAYNGQIGFRFRGRLDSEALRRALDEIVGRHEVLRTRLVDNETGLEQRVTEPQPVPVEFAAMTCQNSEEALRRLAAADLRRSFDLSLEQPLRAILMRVVDDEHVLLVTLDHLTCDARSLDIFHDELCTLYGAFAAGEPSPLAELPIQYADYAVWQRELLAGPQLRDKLADRIRRLADPPTRLALPMTRGRRRAVAGATEVQELPDRLVARARALAARERTSLPNLLLAAFAVVLARISGESDLLLGTLLEGRTLLELESPIGFFVNTAALRLDLSGDPTVAQLLSRVRESTLDAQANQDLPFDLLVEQLRPDRESGGPPLFDMMFQHLELDRATVRLPGMTIEPYWPTPQPAPMDLVLTTTHVSGSYRADWDYNPGLFSTAAIRRLEGHFEQVLDTATADPTLRIGEIPLLTPTERAELLDWSTGPTTIPAPYIHDLVTEQARQHPHHPAVVSGDLSLTFRQLDQHVNHLAAELARRGVGSGTSVGVMMPRGLHTVTAFLAILKAGGTYLPLDPAYPQERINTMIEDARPAFVICDSTAAGRAPDGIPRILLDHGDTTTPPAAASPVISIQPDDIAYVIYTSGSTGRPKGVAITHRGASLIVQAQRSLFGLRPRDRVLQFAALSFDASIFEMLMALGSGAALYPIPAAGLNPADLGQFLSDNAITTATLGPSALAMVPEGTELPALQTLTVAAEACPPALAAQWQEGRRLFNLYGPTETTIWATAHRAQPCDAVAATLPIGRPIAGSHAYVLDSRLELAPIGVSGELVIGGDTLARGYLGKPGQTARRFLPDPFIGRPGARMYRTGDLVQWRDDGRLDFLGRIDDQIKLHGFRIEPAEVEARLTDHPAVRDAAVIVREDTPGHRVLTAYVVAPQRPPAAQLRDHCAGVLPAYMVPGAFVLLDALPFSPNGKVDRRRLPAPRPASSGDSVETAPRTELEDLVAQVWGEVLGTSDIGAFDNFFELGGHSLAATRVITRFRAEFGLRIPVKALFESPVLAEFAESLAAHAGVGAQGGSLT